MKNALRTLSIALLFLLSSCSTKNLMQYYYPFSSKPEINVFKYINPDNTEYSQYWRTTIDPIQRTILTELYSTDFKLNNTFLERVNSNNAELMEYIDYEIIEGSEVKDIIAQILQDQVFSNSHSDTYTYEVKYNNQYGNFTFEKTRRFVTFEDIKVRGRDYKTAKFQDEYSINALDLNEKQEFSQITYYAKGVGMVKYMRYDSSGEISTLELDKVMSDEEFNRKRNYPLRK